MWEIIVLSLKMRERKERGMLAGYVVAVIVVAIVGGDCVAASVIPVLVAADGEGGGEGGCSVLILVYLCIRQVHGQQE